MSHPSPLHAGGSGSLGHRLLYRDIVDERDPAFDAAIALYRRTFPTSERSPAHQIRAVLEDRRLGRLAPDTFRFVVCLEGERVLGMASGRFIDACNVGFVSYLAVDPEEQSRRIGSTLRRHLVSGFRRDSELAGHSHLAAIVGEVEAHNPWLANLIGRGLVLPLDVEYRQPALRPETEPVPLVLYWQPIKEAVPEHIDVGVVVELLRGIYRSIYRIEIPDRDATFLAMIDGLRGRDRVGRRRLRPPGTDGRHRELRHGGDGGKLPVARASPDPTGQQR